MKNNIRTISRLGLALAALIVGGVAVSGSGSSTNFAIDEETQPSVAQNTYSPGFRLIGAIPGSASGDIGISAQYRMHFDDLTPTSFLPDDLVPPVITVAPTVTYVSSTVALIEWQTDEPSDGFVEFGLTPAFGTIASHSGFATLHQVHITTGLAPSTFYFFKARSTDPYANGPTWSALLDFTTTATPDTTGPVVTPTVTFLATTVARVDFVIDEMSQTALHHGPTPTLGTTETDPTWLIARTRTFTGLTAGGSYYYAIDATDPSGNASLGVANLITLPADVAITTTTLPQGTKGKDYQFNLLATGGVGALTFSITSGALPPGLTLSPTGNITGKPSKKGTYTFTLQVADSGTPVSQAIAVLQLSVKDSGGDDEGCTTGNSSNERFNLLLAALFALCLAAYRQIKRAA